MIFKDIDRYSVEVKIQKDLLEKGFKIEQYYHQLLIKEKNPKTRLKLYDEFYTKLLPIYKRDAKEKEESIVLGKSKYINLFQKELKGKSVIDYGSGQGGLLLAIYQQLKGPRLKGVDVFIPEHLKDHPKIEFEKQNLIDYKSESNFDIAFSDNVIEHLVEEDAIRHLSNIYEGLNMGGKLIIIMPNRLFGPTDITRILDMSHSGKTEALGGHVNESTYNQMNEILRTIGFKKLRTVLPIPKLKYSIFKNYRISLDWIMKIEKSPILLSFFRSIKIKGICPVRFTVTIIAEK